MNTMAMCAFLIASVGDSDGEERRQTRTIEEINDLNANKNESNDAVRSKEKLRRAEQLEKISTAGEEQSALRGLNVDGWPSASRRAAADMVERFGQPDTVTDKKLIWEDVGSFKKIMVSRDATHHRFPAPHSDVLTYVVDYRVPASRFDDLAYFDGSLLADRTRGELSARCDSHEMNVAALNLADEVIRGARTVSQARSMLTAVQKRLTDDDPPPIARRLQLDTTRTARTADPDRPATRAIGR